MTQSVDYIDAFKTLKEEETAILRMAREFIDKEWLKAKEGKGLSPVVEYTRAHKFPKYLIKEMANLGFLGAYLPEKYGGMDLDPVSSGLIYYEFERGDSALRSFLSVTNGLVSYPIFKFGSEKQKKKWLPKICAGKKIGCFALTESGGGSNPEGQMRATAVREGNEFVINADKHWITNGTFADVAIVWAKLEGEVRAFLVERKTPGFTSKKIEGKLSFLCSDSSTLSFMNCRIPEENILEGAKGIKAALSCLNEARYGIVWGAIGAAAGCYEAALEYARERMVFNKTKIAAYPFVQQKLVRMLSDIASAQLTCIQLGRLKESGNLRHQQISLFKVTNVEIMRRAAQSAREILGAAGITDDHPPMRHLINAEVLQTYEGTGDIHILIVGRDITGEKAF